MIVNEYENRFHLQFLRIHEKAISSLRKWPFRELLISCFK
jgi:hypothetical protein